MKPKCRHLAPVITFLLLVYTGACRQMRNEAKNSMNAVFSNNPAQPVWESRQWIGSDVVVIEGVKVGSENRMSVFSTWNMDSLFLFFKIEDTCLRACQTEKDHAQLYLDDMVEVLIDTKNDKDSCWAADDIVYHINVLGVKKDDRGTSACLTNPVWDGNGRISVFNFGTINDTTDIDRGYMITLAIPWDELHQKPLPGLIMGVNFANGDNDGKGRQLYDWVGAWPMRSPYAFGELIIMERNIHD